MNVTSKTVKDDIKDTADAARRTISDAAVLTADTARDAADAVSQRAADTAAALSQRASETTTTLSHRASDAMGAVRDRAMDIKDAVVDRASDTMDDARDALGASGERLAETLRNAADGPDPASVPGRVLSAVAGGVASAAHTLRERNLTEIAADVRDLARRNPGAFAAGAAVAGFVLARFLLSSSRHQAADVATGRSYGGARS